MTKQTKASIALANGSYLDYNNPSATDFDIGLIAHALSNICRYGGHSRKFYSVAEHSVLVSRVVPDDLALVGLLHDASEAFVGDMPSPLKKMCQSYRTIENRVQEAIANQFNLPYPFPHDVHVADKRVYLAERKQITDAEDKLWHTEYTPAEVTVTGMPPKDAKNFFLSRYEELTRGTGNELVRRQRAA